MKDETETPNAPLNRAQAQQRVDQIRAFRKELERLDNEAVLTLDNVQRERLSSHHDRTIDELRRLFDVDTSTTEKQMSMGMRVVSLLGSLALAASVFFFFYRIWGFLTTPIQVLILIATPVLAVLGVDLVSGRERTPYFTSLAGLIAFTCFVLNITVLGSIFNLTPSQNAFLPWAVFALILAYRYDLRLLLAAGIICLLGFLSATTGTIWGLYWLSFGERPENFIPAGVLLFLLPTFLAHRDYPEFPGYYRLIGLLTILLAILMLSHWGQASYLLLSPEAVEVIYQLLGFALSGLAVWGGVRLHWDGVTNLGGTFFVIQLYTKFFDWWWDWMPKYLFFLILGLIAVGLLLMFNRLRLQIREATA
ncbi:MAG: DUF2157 domain-containing protein [Nitrospiraceae bacterium]